MDPPSILCYTCSRMTLLAGLVVMALIVVEAPAPVRACPEPKGACICKSVDRSVTCLWLDSLIRRLPVGIPAKTRKLIVNYSTLNKLGPTAFRDCYYLETVDLNDNRLEDISPMAFRHLSRLNVLLLSNNRLRFLTGEVFTHLKTLRELDLSSNRLIVLTPKNFAQLRSLQTLNLRNNPTMCIAPDAFAGLHNLENLEMSHMISSLKHELLMDSPKLRTLVIDSFLSVKSIPEYFFKNNKNLRELHFENLRSLSNKGLPDNLLTGLKELKILSLKACNLTRIPRETLHRVQWGLRSLDLSKNTITSLREHDLKFLSGLQTLNLKSTGLVSISANALDLKKLHTLDISRNNLKVLMKDVFGERINLSLRNVTIGSNPWICDCEFEWLLHTRFLHPSDLPVVCVNPPLMRGHEITLPPSSNRNEDHFSCQAPIITTFGIQPDNSISLELGIESAQESPGGPAGNGKTNSLVNACLVCETSSAHPTVDIQVNEVGTVSLKTLRPDQAVGTYTCRAKNKLGIVERSFEIRRTKGGASHPVPPRQGNASLTARSVQPVRQARQGYSLQSRPSYRSGPDGNINQGHLETHRPRASLMPTMPLLAEQGVFATHINGTSSEKFVKFCVKNHSHPPCGGATEEVTSSHKIWPSHSLQDNGKSPVLAGSSNPNGNVGTRLRFNMLVLMIFQSLIIMDLPNLLCCYL